MNKEEIILHVDSRSIRITHPDKVLYPSEGITKMDLINYYLSVAPDLLRLNRGRPVVFIRFPHGLGKISFFQKNVPDNHPEWMEVVEMGKYKPVKYLILNSIADLIWFVQLHALEFHVINIRKPLWDFPDWMVFDIDPPPGAGFEQVRDFAMAVKPVLEESGYRVFVKTSGKRGVHLICPVVQKYTVDQVMQAAKDLAEKIIARFPEKATLEVRKNKREAKFLIDIYRNRPFQTFSMALGTRATEKASVSMPLSWEELKKTKDPREYNIKTVPAYLRKKDVAWADISAHATNLHIFPAD